MKFIGIIDKDNQKTKEGAQVFTTHDDSKFGEGLANLIRSAYSELFDLHGEPAWALDRDALISYFRGSDETSAVTGSRQALTFQTLSSLALKRQDQVATRSSPTSRSTPKDKKPAIAKSRSPSKTETPATKSTPNAASPVGLTVRIEINLPANGSQATYDNIFESIRKNLLNAPA